MTAKRWFILEHTFATALLVVAFATGCGGSKASTARPAPFVQDPKVEYVTDAFYADGASRTFQVVRVRVENGWLYVTLTSSGGASQTFIPDGK